MTQRFLLLNFRVAAESAFDSFFIGKMAKDSSAENLSIKGLKNLTQRVWMGPEQDNLAKEKNSENELMMRALFTELSR